MPICFETFCELCYTSHAIQNDLFASLEFHSDDEDGEGAMQGALAGATPEHVDAMAKRAQQGLLLSSLVPHSAVLFGFLLLRRQSHASSISQALC